MTPYKGRYRVTSARGYREYRYNGMLIKETHVGVDAVGTDSKDHRSVWDCVKVAVSIGYNSGRGNLVYLYYSNVLRMLYQHLERAYITANSTVRQGTVVSREGSTGQVTGSHLHAEAQVLKNGVWQPVGGPVLAQYTEMPNVVTPEGKYYTGNDNLDAASAAGEPVTDPEPATPQDGKVYVPCISIAKAGALELFTDPNVAAVIKGDGPGLLVNGTRRLDAGNFIGLEKVVLKGMPAGENAEGYKVLYGGEKLYVATKLAFASVQQRSMEQIADEFKVEAVG